MKPVRPFAAVAAIALALTGAPAAAQVASSVIAPPAPLFLDLPGPDALYDPDQGAPEALAPAEVPRDTLFPGLQAPWRSDLQAFRRRLFDQYGLTLFASYQQLTQYATDGLPGAQRWALGGWAGVGGTWTPLDRGGDFEGTLVVRAGWRGPVGNNNPWPAVFGPVNLGSAWSAYEFTSWRDRFVIEDLFWEQHIGRNFNFRIGNQAPQTTVNTFRFKDARTGFTASPLAFSETIPYPAFGLGFSFRWRPLPGRGLYVNGVANDMNGNPGQGVLDWSKARFSQLFVGVEVGHQWRRAGGEYDQLALLLFNAGDRRTFNPEFTPNEPGSGFKILGEKQWNRIVGFAAYTYNTARGGGISTTFSGHTAVAGAALLRPFGVRGEAAVAGMWSRPFRDIFPGSGQRDQFGLETYWNVAVTPNMTLTPGLQLIFNPSFNPRDDIIAVPHLKFRVFL